MLKITAFNFYKPNLFLDVLEKLAKGYEPFADFSVAPDNAILDVDGMIPHTA